MRQDSGEPEELIIRKRRSARSSGIARACIIDHGAVTREIARTLVGGRNRQKLAGTEAFVHAFPAAEEEQLIAADWSAQRHAIDIGNVLRLGGRIEEILSLHGGVIMESPCGAMQLVGTGLRDHRNSRTSGQPLFGIEVVRRDVDGFDSFCRRDIGSVMRQPEKHAQCAIDARRIVIAVNAIHVDGKRSRRSRLYGVLVLSGRGARHQVDEALVIPVVRQRDIDDLLGTDFGVHVGFIGLQGHRPRLHGYCLIRPVRLPV